MKVLCSLDTMTGEMMTTCDDKHVPHDSFAISSYFMTDTQDGGDPAQYGYFSYCSKAEDGTTTNTYGHLKIGDSKSYSQTDKSNYNVSKACANLDKVAQATIMLEEAIKTKK